LAIHAFTRQRTIDYLSPIFAVVGPDNARKAVDRLREVIFPEDLGRDVDYKKKAQDMMKMLMGVELRVKPVKAKKYGGVD
jgi:hypothetical protein